MNVLMSTCVMNVVNMATQNVVVDLTKGEKLDGTNYDMWHRKIQYQLNEQKVLETLTNVMCDLKMGILPNIAVIQRPMSLGLRKIVVHALRC